MTPSRIPTLAKALIPTLPKPEPEPESEPEPEPSLNPNPNPTPTEQERNALICGASLFLWFVLRRLVDIQGKLHESRAMHKAVGGVPTGGVPMGMPVGKPGKPLKGE